MTLPNRWLLAASLAMILALPLLLGAGNDKTTSNSARRNDIAAMSQDEQAKLKRQYATFQSMTPAQQDKYRSLHVSLEKDTQQGGSLSQVVKTYRTWLKTLSAWEINELRRESDPKERIALVRKFKEEHIREKEIRSFRNGSVPFLRRGTGPRLSLEDLAAVLDLVVARLVLSAEDRQTLAGETGLKRHIHIASLILRGGDARRWPDDQLLDDILEKVSDERIRRQLSDGAKSENRRGSLRRVIASTLLAEMQADMKKNQPSDEQIEAFFLELDSRKRDNLMGLSADDVKRRLRFLYMTEHRDEYAADWSRMRPILMQLMPQGSGRPGFRGQGRFNGGGRGDRRRPEDGGKFKRPRGDAPPRKPAGRPPPFLDRKEKR